MFALETLIISRIDQRCRLRPFLCTNLRNAMPSALQRGAGGSFICLRICRTRSPVTPISRAISLFFSDQSTDDQSTSLLRPRGTLRYRYLNFLAQKLAVG